MSPTTSILPLLLLLSLSARAQNPALHRKPSPNANSNAPLRSDVVLQAFAHLVNTDLGIDAVFTFEGFADGTPTFVTVQGFDGFYGNVDDGAPYKYHVHTNPLDSSGSCATALAHLDPLSVSESITCDPAFPAFCQLGDLSGKHGKLNGTDTGVQEKVGYSDDYLRWFPEEVSFLGRSVVIHANNATRLACGNITSEFDGTMRDGRATNRSSTFVKNFPTSAPASPGPVITPLVGTVFPDQETLDNLPIPFPAPALAISQSQFITLTTTTNSKGATVPAMAALQVVGQEQVEAYMQGGEVGLAELMAQGLVATSGAGRRVGWGVGVGAVVVGLVLVLGLV